MKRKLVFWIGMSILCILLFTACNPLSNEDTIVHSWEDTLAKWKSMLPKDVEEHVTMEVSETYRIDADVLIPNELESYEVDTIELTRHVYDDVENVLEKWINYCEIESDEEIVVTEKEDVLEDGTYMQFAKVSFGEDEDSQAQVRSTYALMSTPFSLNYGIWSLQQVYNKQAMGRFHHEYMKEPSEKKLITEAEILDIKENVETIFETEYLTEYELYTCTLERLTEAVEWEQEYMRQLGMEEEPWNVTEADEGTVLFFRQGYEDIPLLTVGVSSDETGAVWSVNSYCMVISSKEEIKGLNLYNPYDVKGKNETVEIMSFAELVEEHVADSQGVDTTVVHVGLYYLPIYSGDGLDFLGKPVWYVQVEMESDMGYLTRDGVLYDAVTGEIIKW